MLIVSKQRLETNLVEIVLNKTANLSGNLAYTFLKDGETETGTLTYKQLGIQVQAIAAYLQSITVQGDRILLLYPSGLEFITVFLGCLYAKVIAVPAYPPRRNQRLERILAIVNDAQPTLVLTTHDLLEQVRSEFQELGLSNIPCSSIETLPDERAADWKPPIIYPDDLAFLQYTSGSTGTPKGVMVSHENIIYNQEMLKLAWQHNESTRLVSWLPLFHDMGLLSKVLQSLYLGVSCTFMPPIAFLQKPLRWLQAISNYQATTSGAPNFAYDLCVNRISVEQREGLDLRRWNVAFNGAEPIRAETLEHFTKIFADYGFKPEAFFPCYGMAEATLIISGGIPSHKPVLRDVQASALEKDRIILCDEQSPEGSKTLVGCGSTLLDQEIIIVDPNSCVQCPSGKIGEIWISGKNVTQGYWNHELETQTTFAAYVSGTNKGPYLRTGDLGFMDPDGELFVTGRLKEVIIIRGRNYYPQDIERIAEKSHAALRPNNGAAFSVEIDGQERLIIAHEVERSYLRKLNVVDIANTIRRSVSERFDLQVHSVVLLRTNSLLKTSSGKIQRRACRSAFLNRTLNEVGRDELSLSLLKSNIEEPQTGLSVGQVPTITQENQELQDLGQAGLNSEKETSRLVDWLRSYASNYINSRLIDERRCIPPYVVLDFGNQGILGLQVPAAYGGLGLSNYGMCRVMEQLGAIDVSLALFVGNNSLLSTRPILKSAPIQLQEEILPLIAQGRELAAFALTEPGAGSNPRAITSTAIPTGTNQWQLQGEKIWIGNGSWAGVTSVFVQALDEKQKPLGMTGFVVRRGTKGFRPGSEALTMGMRGMVQNRLYFNSVPVNADCLLGEVGKGFAIAQDAMIFGRLMLGVISLGGMKRCSQLILRYSSRRSVATGRLLENPATLVPLGRLCAAITALEALVFAAAQLLDRGCVVPEEIYSVCKVSGAEFYWQATDQLVQTLGGRGFVETNLAPQMLRDARVLRIFEGPTETLNVFLGSRVLYKGEALFQFLCHSLSSPTVADRLQAAVNQVSERFSRTSYFQSSGATSQWMHLCVGELVNWAILQASVQFKLQSIADPKSLQQLERAATWTSLEFDRKLQEILAGTPEEQVVYQASTLAADIQDYTASIGLVEQTLAGEEHELDEWLRPESTQIQFNGQLTSNWSKGSDDGFRKDSASKLNDQPLVKSLLIDSQPLEQASLNSIVSNGYSYESITEWIKVRLGQILGINTEAINTKDAFVDYGIDSVLAVQLVQDLEDWLKISLDPNLLWNFPTLDALAQHLYQPIQEKSGISPSNPFSEFNLETEVVLDPTIHIKPRKFIKTCKFKRVFLTGATGFLGAFLLSELLNYTNTDVYCLVRADSLDLAKQRLQNNLKSYLLWNENQSARIIPVLGDISQPQLGLSNSGFENLASQIDSIYHSAAHLNFVYPYRSLKSTNVNGTQEIIRLASLVKSKPLHYISSVAVFESRIYQGQVVTESDSLTHSEGIYMGYSQSKWVAEKLVQLAGEQGLPICIYRPALIAGHSTSGAWNTNDFTCRFIKGCIQLGKFPALDWIFDLSPVDYVAKAIVTLSQSPEMLGKTFHLQHPDPIHWNHAMNWITALGYPMESIPYDQWLEILINRVRAYPDNALAPLIPFFSNRWSTESGTIAELYTQRNKAKISCQETFKTLLQMSDTVCPIYSLQSFKTYFKYFTECGFLYEL